MEKGEESSAWTEGPFGFHFRKKLGITTTLFFFFLQLRSVSARTYDFFFEFGFLEHPRVYSYTLLPVVQK
jgi:hypothetical protein